MTDCTTKDYLSAMFADCYYTEKLSFQVCLQCTCWFVDQLLKKIQKTMFALAKTKIQNSNHCKVLLKCGWKVWESLETHFTQILNEMCQQIWNPCDRKLWIIRI